MVGVFGDSELNVVMYMGVKNVLFLVMLMFMLLKCDVWSVIKFGLRMLGGFIVVVFSIMVGFIFVYVIFKNFYVEDMWKVFGVLLGSWIGGLVNMVVF